MSINDRFFPKVTIVIPVYNGKDYLPEAIDSALAQTYPNLEVIVVNDGSCDGGETEKIALSYGNRIRYFKKENGGVSTALNLGIQKMTGDYFSWLSHDDAYAPEKVANSVAYLERFRSEDRLIALCGASYINAQSEKIRDVNYRFQKDTVYSGVDVISYILRNGVINGCCMLIPRTAFAECGLFHEDLRYNQDALMWFQIFGAGYKMIADIEQRDVMYRLHRAQTSKTRQDLLFRDSYELSKIILPLFAEKSTADCNLMKLFAKRNARLACVDAVDECIRVGAAQGQLNALDVAYIKMWLLLGKFRSVARRVYHKLAF